MVNNAYKDKKGRYEIKKVTLETVDQAVYDYFDKRLAVSVDTEREKVRVPVIFATGERWKLVRDNKGLRDQNGTLILPLITVRRVRIDRNPGMHALAQETPNITVSSLVHEKSSNIANMVQDRRVRGFPEPKRPVVREYLTVPFPDFCTIFYEIGIWSQYQTQMNEILEKIFYNYDHLDSFIMPVEYDGKSRKGNSYYFVGFREDVAPQSNVQEFTDQERIIKYSYTIKTPAYLMLDPKDETLAYGRNKGEVGSDGGKVVFKEQNTIEIKLKESIISREDFEKLFG
jgi:hypothetical protein